QGVRYGVAGANPCFRVEGKDEHVVRCVGLSVSDCNSSHQANLSYAFDGRLMRSHGPEGSLAQAVIRRFNVLRPLSKDAVVGLEQAILEGFLRAGPGEDLIVEGDPVDSVRLVLSGWLFRHKTLEDGRRQIVNFILPGETCDAHAFLLSRIDHS